jgi:cytosine/adenosine deaminase-related metal-dependent hydrolase
LEAGKVVTLSDGGEMVYDVSTPEHLDREAGVEFFPGVIVPGFCNAHSHLELSGLRGAIPPGGGFTAFARGMRGARRTAETDDAATFWDARMWAEGVSAVVDICNGDTTLGVKLASRIEYFNFCELFGLGADPARAFALCDKVLATGLTATVTPHSTYSLSRAAFENVSGSRPFCSPSPAGGEMRLAMQAGALSIHFMESDDEVDLFRRKGPLWDWYRDQGLRPDFLDYGSPAERLVAQVPKDRAVMLVHNCVVTQRDIDIVMDHFTAPVTWVVCPGSNRYIGNPAPPVGLLRKNGLRIAVGTDSLASNDTLNMVRELSLIEGVPLAELLSWVTVGSIEPGRSTGLVLLTGMDMSTLTITESTKARRII